MVRFSKEEEGTRIQCGRHKILYLFGLVLYFCNKKEKEKRKPSCSFPDRPPSAEQ